MILWDFSDCGANCHKQCKDLLVLACRRFARAPSLGSSHGSLPGSPSLPPGKFLYFLSHHDFSRLTFPYLDLGWVLDLNLFRIIINTRAFFRVGSSSYMLESTLILTTFKSH